jgi:hypothetical protein
MHLSLKFVFFGALIISPIIPSLSVASGNHSSLLLELVSNKIKMTKWINAAEADTELCQTHTQYVTALMKPTLHMLSEYSQEKSGHYVNQTAYADSLEQRAKMLEHFSVLLERLFNLKQTC